MYIVTNMDRAIYIFMSYLWRGRLFKSIDLPISIVDAPSLTIMQSLGSADCS